MKSALRWKPNIELRRVDPARHHAATGDHSRQQPMTVRASNPEVREQEAVKLAGTLWQRRYDFARLRADR